MKKISLFLSVLFFFGTFIQSNAQDINPNDWQHLKGYWKFQNNSNLLKATVGNDLILSGTHQFVKGPVSSDTAVRIGIGSFYRAYHNMSPNGGGNNVNQYSLLFDFKVSSLNKWKTFYQTDTTNLNDGEFFVRPNTGSNPGRIGTATTGYSNDSLVLDKWYRLVISVNLGHHFRYYLDGVLIHEGDTQDVDDRFSLTNNILFFADNNQEDDEMDIASVAVFDTCLSASDVSKLGTVDPCLLYPFKVSLGSDTSICGSASLTKSVGGKSFLYDWSTGEKDSMVTFSMAKHGSGNKTIWVKKTDVNGCFQSDTFKLGIFSAPSVNLGNDIEMCIGQSQKFTAGPASNHTYTWSKLPSGQIISQVNNYTIDSSGTYVVKMQNSTGCVDYDTIVATVYDNSKQPLINSSQLGFCDGDSSILESVNVYSKYLWFNGDTTKSIHIFSSELVYFKTFDAFGCESPNSDSLQITAFQNPIAPVLKYSPDTSFCAGDSCILYISESFKDIFWNDAFPNASRVVKSSGSFNVYFSDLNGCLSPISNNINITAFPLPLKPEIQLVMGSVDLCPGDSVTLGSTDSAFIYLWNNGLKTRNFTVKNSGDFYLIHQNEFGCVSDTSNKIETFLHSKPNRPSIQAIGYDSLTCISMDTIYNWEIKGQSGFLTNKTIAGIDKKVYAVRTSNGFCWSDFSDTFFFEKTALFSPNKMRPSISIYPNPSDVIVNIKAVDFQGELLAIQILNVKGQLCVFENMNTEDILKGKSISVMGFESGIYSLLLLTDKGVFAYKFTIK